MSRTFLANVPKHVDIENHVTTTRALRDGIDTTCTTYALHKAVHDNGKAALKAVRDEAQGKAVDVAKAYDAYDASVRNLARHMYGNADAATCVRAASADGEHGLYDAYMSAMAAYNASANAYARNKHDADKAAQALTRRNVAVDVAFDAWANLRTHVRSNADTDAARANVRSDAARKAAATRKARKAANAASERQANADAASERHADGRKARTDKAHADALRATGNADLAATLAGK